MSHDPYAFMSPATAGNGVVLRTPMDRRHAAAGATFAERDGWRIAEYEGEPADPWLADVSDLGKLDVRGSQAELDELTGGLPTGAARRDGDVWTLRLTPIHGYVLCPYSRVEALRGSVGAAAIDVTSALAGVALGGSRWRDVMNRSSGLDVRPSRFGPGRCMAGSVMRVPTLIVNEGESIAMFVGWEYGEYFWDAIIDAGETLGIGPRTPVQAAVSEAVA
jgi:glycine cleavage system aminomethyltransferase T